MKTIIVFALIGYALYYYCKQSTNNTMCQLVMLGAIGFVIYSLFSTSEMFTVEIPAWKKTCTNNDGRSECCCPNGFNGQDVTFEYTNDADRLKCQKTAQEMMAGGPGGLVVNQIESYTGGGCGCGL
jgi:hypothetical protein